MKIEARGKYAGVKVHLEATECQLFIDLAKKPTPKLYQQAGELSEKLGKKILKLLVERPNLLKERTQEEIQHELEVELESAQKKIKALKSGGDWTQIHIK